MQLRDYQQRGVEDIRSAYRAGARSPLYVAPVGSGKTVLFSYIAHHAAARGNRVIILVHRRELLHQTGQRLTESGTPYGVIAPQAVETAHLVQVASVQTLARRLALAERADLIVIDESHHATAATWTRVLEAAPNAKILGVTATPCRLDGRGLGASCGGHFDTLVLGPTVSELITAGWLSAPRVYAPPYRLDMGRVRTRAGDYAQDDLSGLMRQGTITGDAVDHYRRLCNRVPAIAFCVSIAHADEVAAQFRGAGYRARTISGTQSTAERDACIAGLNNGTLDVLTSCEICGEGLDVGDVGATIHLRPTQSLGLWRQQMGRGMRPSAARGNVTFVLDHADNWLRLGLPTMEPVWSLNAPRRGRVANASPQPLTQCTACYAVFPSGRPACPRCGEPLRATTDPRRLVLREGELVRIEDRAAAQRAHEAAARERRMEEGRCRTLEDFQALAAARGYRQGWAMIRWAARQNRRAVSV